jgi:flagellar basal body P-ring formation protein FlgA
MRSAMRPDNVDGASVSAERARAVPRRPRVGLLTRGRRLGRDRDGGPSRVAALLGLAALVLAGPRAGAEPAARWHPVEDIAATAEGYLRDTVGAKDPRIEPRAGSLDPRLQLPACSTALDAFLQQGTRVASRTIVGVRCDGDKPWKVYVPVDVVVTESVLVAKRSLPAGRMLTADDVVAERQDVSRLVGGYFVSRDSSAGPVAGKRLKHPLMAGRIVTPSMLEDEVVIERGQTVTLVIAGDGLSVSMAGKALMDGAADQRIRVRNTGSGRVVEGFVRSSEVVEVLVD